MKHFLLALPLLLWACGAKGTEIMLTASGVAIADLEAIRADLAGVKGVQNVRAGQLKDGQATFALTFEGKGGDLAAALARLGSGLKNVKGFDDASVQIAFGGGEAPKVAPSGVVALAKAMTGNVQATPAPAPVTVTPVAVAETPTPVPAVQEEKKDVKKEDKAAPPAQAPVTAPQEEKRDKPEKKDPLAYKVHQLAAGSIATFDNWKINPLPGDANWSMMETHPEGKENDFQMIVAAGTPGAQVMANLFEEGNKFFHQIMPAIKAVGEPQKTLIGGDEARIQDWTLETQGKTLKVQTVIIKKKDVAVSLMAFGNDASFKEYGRAVGITAQSITVKADPPDPILVGTWTFDRYTSTGAGTSNKFSYSSSTSMTIYQNGTFSESSMSSAGLDTNTARTDAYIEGGNRGKVVKRGTTLSFQYDNGKVWNAEYKMDGGALMLNGKMWLRN